MSRFRLFDLNPAQEEAVRTIHGPLLVLAGAGTGKTRVITARIAYLISEGVPPGQILAVTFTNKAAREMRERVEAIIGTAEARSVTISTFHALCVRILRQEIERLGYKRNFSIYSEGEQLGLIKKIITRTAARDEKLEPSVARALISKAKNNGMARPTAELSLVDAVFARYQTELKTLNAVDFDDLLLLSVRLFREHDDLRVRWRDRFRFLLVDEFQDTNGLQLDLIGLLANAPHSAAATDERDKSAPRPNVCVVGDDDQSIYGWRGAAVSNILEFERHFPSPKVVTLEENYRSTNAILRTANALIKNNARRRPKKLWSARDDGALVRVIQMSDDRQEAEFIANEIARRQTMEQAPWNAIAVLFRMNAQSRALEQSLRAMRIPYRVVGGQSYFDAREIKDLLAYASTLLNRDDDVSLLRIINMPARGITASVTDRATEFSIAHRCSVLAALQNEVMRASLSKRQREAIDNFAALLDRYEARLHQPLSNPAEILRELVAEIEYLDELRRSCKTPEETLKRENSVHELLRWLDEYQTRSGKGVQGFLDEMLLRQEREEDTENEQVDAVTLITLHAAKGLEFPHVYLSGVEEGVLPHDRSKLEGTIDEERRLLYVGITRAMRTLTLSWCRSRTKYGSAVPCFPSSFIKEFPAECIEHCHGGAILNAPVQEARAKAGFSSILDALGS
jgi:superfamily I DNA/RNA helicase